MNEKINSNRAFILMWWIFLFFTFQKKGFTRALKHRNEKRIRIKILKFQINPN